MTAPQLVYILIGVVIYALVGIMVIAHLEERKYIHLEETLEPFLAAVVIFPLVALYAFIKKIFTR